jgi:hypothetical protein
MNLRRAATGAGAGAAAGAGASRTRGRCRRRRGGATGGGAGARSRGRCGERGAAPRAGGAAGPPGGGGAGAAAVAPPPRCSSIRARTSPRVIRPPNPVPRGSASGRCRSRRGAADHRREDQPRSPDCVPGGCRIPTGSRGRGRRKSPAALGRRAGTGAGDRGRGDGAGGFEGAGGGGAGAGGGGRGRGWSRWPPPDGRWRLGPEPGAGTVGRWAPAPSETTARIVPRRRCRLLPPGSRPGPRSAGDGTSESTLSVDTSNKGSSRATCLADRLQPLGDRAFGDRLTELWHGHISQRATPFRSAPAPSLRTPRRGSGAAG